MTTRRTSLAAARVELRAVPHLWAAFVNRMFVALRAPARPALAKRRVLDKGVTDGRESRLGRTINFAVQGRLSNKRDTRYAWSPSCQKLGTPMNAPETP